MGIRDTEVTLLDGTTRRFGDLAPGAALIVNVASKCGFTPQYEGLEAIHREYGPRGLTVIGMPCNQFLKQEPGTAEEIGEFCKLNYGVTFPLMAKCEVNGPQAHPLFAWLKAQAPGVLGTRAIKWNFTKFLLGRDGRVIGRYAPRHRPEALAADIEAALGQP